MLLAVSISPGLGWGIVLVLGAIWISLGVLWGRKAKTSEGFVLAGSGLGLIPLAVILIWMGNRTYSACPAPTRTTPPRVG